MPRKIRSNYMEKFKFVYNGRTFESKHKCCDFYGICYRSVMAYQNQYKCRTEEAITHFIELKKSKEIIFRNRKWASIKTCCEFYDLNEDSVKTDMWNRKCTPQEAIERAIEWKKAHEITYHGVKYPSLPQCCEDLEINPISVRLYMEKNGVSSITISAQQKESAETIKALKMIKDQLGICTTLGVSNISFGLPRREIVNGTFFALALNNGLDACIINPCADSMINTYRAFMALSCYDADCQEYVSKYAGTKSQTTVTKENQAEEKAENVNPLFDIIIKGLKDQSFDETVRQLETTDPMDIINNILVEALNVVGREFEKGTMFLPQLMMSAETVKNSFDAIKAHIDQSGETQESKGKILVATVKGDIHDIGKNIVKVLLENYGYDVYDLGKDVPPELIVETLKENDIHICGLSALMTTTVVSMEDTIKAIRAAGLDTKVWVGGAVLTQEYADMIGADKYCKDALSSVTYANEFFGN